MTSRPEGREILFCQSKQAHRRSQPASMHAVSGKFEMLLQMHEAARGLDQTLKVIRVARGRLQPEMLEDIVRFVVALLIPAAKEPAIAGMLGNLAPFLGR